MSPVMIRTHNVLVGHVMKIAFRDVNVTQFSILSVVLGLGQYRIGFGTFSDPVHWFYSVKVRNVY